jgi:hypothetical protein
MCSRSASVCVARFNASPDTSMRCAVSPRRDAFDERPELAAIAGSELDDPGHIREPFEHVIPMRREQPILRARDAVPRQLADRR